MHLARRGGHKSEKKIPPADVDGAVQTLRLALAEQDSQYIPKTVTVDTLPVKTIRTKGKRKLKAIGVNRVAAIYTSHVYTRISHRRL